MSIKPKSSLLRRIDFVTFFLLFAGCASLNDAQPPYSHAFDHHENVATYNAREIYHTFDVHNRLTSQVLAGTRVEDDFSAGIPAAYTAQSGTWSVTGGVLGNSGTDYELTCFSVPLRLPSSP